MAWSAVTAINFSWIALLLSPASAHVVATVTQCIRPDLSSNTATWAQVQQLFAHNKDVPRGTMVADGCGIYCSQGLPYLTDRCWTPRSYCLIRPSTVNYSIKVSVSAAFANKYQPGYEFQAAKYIVLLGPASALGAASTVHMDQLLEESGVTVINLGLPAAGPHWFLDAWKVIEDLVVNAVAVVIHTMAGRSSPNPFCDPAEVRPNECFAIHKQAVEDGDTEKAAAMVEGSLLTAIADYTELMDRIDNSTLKVGATPAKYLLWLSNCDPSVGCSDPGFPQWYTQKEQIDRLFALPWDRVLDANYKDNGKFGLPNPVNKCDPDPCPTGHPPGCKRRDPAYDSSVCPTLIARKESLSGDRNGPHNGCTHTCAYAVNKYYPTEHGHIKAHGQVLKALREDGLDGFPHCNVSADG